MDCLEAQAIISAQRDGEVISETELSAARAHCAECPDCAAFDSGLKWLAVMPSPNLPDGLVDRVLGAVSVVAAERAETERIEADRLEAESAQAAALAVVGTLPEPEAELAPERASARWLGEVPARWFDRVPAPARWAGLGALATIAATALIAFVVLSGGPGDASKSGATTETGAPAAASPDMTFSGDQQRDGSALGSAQTPTAPAKAPDYILFRGVVFSPGSLLTDSNSATPTIGTVNTAFASTGGPQQATVLRSPLSDGSIVVQGPDGLRVYAPVVRMLSSIRYQLTAGNTLDRFGVWPTLPTRFAAPTSPDGSPSFVASGVDALGVSIYAASGRPVSEGFAVAPVTPASDPAGSNPNWTWWAPMRNQAQ